MHESWLRLFKDLPNEKAQIITFNFKYFQININKINWDKKKL